MTFTSATSARSLRSALIAAAAALLVACGGPANDSTGTPPPPAAAPAPATTPAADAAAAPVAAAAATAVKESATPVVDTTGEQLKLASAAPATDREWRYKEGQDFKLLTTSQGTTSSPDKIEVAEVFWYGCGHCFQFDPVITDYAAKLPGDTAFVRLPVMWNPTNQIHARIFYTAQALNKINEMNAAIFREIHVNKKMLTDEEDIQAFFGKFGVSATDFQKTFRSFQVESQLKRARDLTDRYQVRSVPLIIVNGKYSADGPGIKSYDDMLKVVSELVERERSR